MYGLDLRLILTNAFGFLLLVFILRKLAWGHILGAIDARRAAIQREVDAAERLRAEAEQLRGGYEARLTGIEAEARARLQAAVHDAERIAGEIKDAARADVRELMTKTEQRLRIEHAAALVRLKEEMVDLTIRAAERVVQESLDGDRQRRLVREFLDEIEATRA